MKSVGIALLLNAVYCAQNHYLHKFCTKSVKIDSNTKATLDYWLDNASYRLARRAWLVAMHLDGNSTKSLASTVAMTEQRVVEVISRYDRYGLMGLFDLPRSGKPSAQRERGVRMRLVESKLSCLDLEASDIASEINTSKDLVWRQARLANIVIDRERQRVIKARTKLTSWTPVVGCVMAPGFQLLAMTQAAKQAEQLSPVGVLDSVSRELSSAISTSEKIGQVPELDTAISLALHCQGKVPARAAQERRTRLVERLDRLEDLIQSPLRIHISGDIKSNNYGDWITALQRSRYWSINPKDRFFFFKDFGASGAAVSPRHAYLALYTFWCAEMAKRVCDLKEELVWYRSHR